VACFGTLQLTCISPLDAAKQRFALVEAKDPLRSGSIITYLTGYIVFLTPMMSAFNLRDYISE